MDIQDDNVNFDLIRIFENTEQYKSQIKPFKQQITDENSREQMKQISDQIRYIINNKDKYPPQVNLNAVRFLKETVNLTNNLWKEVVQESILESLKEVALFHKEDKNDDRGRQYFANPSQQQGNNIQAFGNSYLRLVLECIEVWGTVYEQSEFNQVFEYLRDEEKVKFPDQFNYFKEFKKNLQQSQASNNATPEKQQQNGGGIISQQEKQEQEQIEKPQEILKKKGPSLRQEIEDLKVIYSEQQQIIQAIFDQPQQPEDKIQSLEDELQIMSEISKKIRQILAKIKKNLDNGEDEYSEDYTEMEINQALFEGYGRRFEALRQKKINLEIFEKEFGTFFLQEETLTPEIQSQNNSSLINNNNQIQNLKKLEKIEEDELEQAASSQIQNKKPEFQKKIQGENPIINKQNFIKSEENSQLNQNNKQLIKQANPVQESSPFKSQFESIIKGNQHEKVPMKNGTNFTKLDPNSSFYSNNNSNYVKYSSIGGNSSINDQSRYSLANEDNKKPEIQTLLKEKNIIAQQLENALKEIQKLKIENQNLKDELIHYKQK